MKHTAIAGQWNKIFSAAEMTNDKFIQVRHPERTYLPGWFLVWTGEDATGVTAEDAILWNINVPFPARAGVGVHVWPVGLQAGTEVTVVSIDDGV